MIKTKCPTNSWAWAWVVGLHGTGDGGDFLPTMRPLEEMMKRFDDPGLLEKDLKNANDVAIVMLSVLASRRMARMRAIRWM